MTCAPSATQSFDELQRILKAEECGDRRGGSGKLAAGPAGLCFLTDSYSSEETPTGQADAEQAGPSVGELQDRLKVGKKIYVTEQDGREMTGRFTELTLVGLIVMQEGARREIPLAAVRQIQTPDPLWTGVLIGAGIGGAMSLTIRSDSACPARSAGCLNEERAARVGFPLWGGLIGLWLDWLHDGRKTIYRASDGKTVGAVVTVAPGQRAFVVSVIF